MRCPKCQSAFEKVATAQGVVDRCTGCSGLWFDLLEHEELKAYARELDTGDAATGAQYNAVDRIRCPVCPNSPMVRMVDPGQPHLWLESCPTCYGHFFDAGEYRDYASHTFSDFLKRFRVQARL